MKKIRVYLYLALWAVLCSSCFTSWLGFSSEQLMKIQKGMTKEEVKQVFGKPSFIRFDEVVEEWEFREIAAAGWSVAIVRFIDGKVVELNTFLEKECPHGKSDDTIVNNHLKQ